jgi:hypothetical protein
MTYLKKNIFTSQKDYTEFLTQKLISGRNRSNDIKMPFLKHCILRNLLQMPKGVMHVNFQQKIAITVPYCTSATYTYSTVLFNQVPAPCLVGTVHLEAKCNL